jgi:hypothetical protein
MEPLVYLEAITSFERLKRQERHQLPWAPNSSRAKIGEITFYPPVLVESVRERTTDLNDGSRQVHCCPHYEQGEAGKACLSES